LRRHRVIETYLAAILGYSWDRVHAEAERLEHAASDELIDRMAEALGEPTTDPHGAPIPTRDGMVDEAIYRPLDSLVPEEIGRVIRMIHDNAEMPRYLDELGLRPGVNVCVKARAPFGGPITVEVYGSRRFIAPSLTAQVLVTAAD
jgi:DtxR family Mn-dependent transcriptional regulator